MGRSMSGHRGQALQACEAGEGADCAPSGTEARVVPSRGGTSVLKERLAVVWLESVWGFLPLPTHFPLILCIVKRSEVLTQELGGDHR